MLRLARDTGDVVATDPRIADEILDFLRDEDLVRLQLETAKRPVRWEEFRQMKMPGDLTPEKVWEILSVWRKHAGFEARCYQTTGACGWYTITSRIATMLYSLDARGSSEAALSRAIAERSGAHFVIQPLIDETIASARRDGVAIDHETVRALLLEERGAESEAEQMVLNSHRLFLDVEAYRDRTFDNDLIAELAARIGEGVERFEPVPLPHSWQASGWALADPATCIREICAMANREGDYAFVHPLVMCINIASTLWTFHPIPRWNGMVEMALRRLLLLNNGYPALMYVPFCRAHLAWEEGAIHPPAVFSTYGQALFQCEDGTDWTPYIDVAVGLLVSEMEGLERVVRAIQAREERLMGIIEADPAIDERQKRTIHQALLVPDTEFRISSYRRAHNVVTTTARRDLFGLVDLGFLRCEHRGKELIFTAPPDFKSLIEKHTRFVLFDGNGSMSSARPAGLRSTLDARRRT